MIDKFYIFGRSSCPFCLMAADLLVALSAQYQFLDYEQDQDILEEYKDFYNQSTVPIILASNLETGKTKKIGGYTDLLRHVDE